MATFGLIVLCSTLIFSQAKPLVDNGYVCNHKPNENVSLFSNFDM